MIWLVNHTDALGMVFQDLIQAQQLDFVAMTTTAMPGAAAIGQYQGGEVLWWQDRCYPLAAIQFVYCGILSVTEPSPVLPHQCKDWIYVTNAWQAWLRYGLAQVPLSLGVLPDICWIDTWRYLPTLASLAPRYGMLAPVYRYVGDVSYGDQYAYLSRYLVDDIACFSAYKADSVLALSIPKGLWLQCGWIGGNCYVIRYEQGDWVPHQLPHHQIEAIGSLTRSWGLSVCQYVLRQHKTGEISLYGASPQLGAKVISLHITSIRNYLQKEYLAQCC